MMNLMAPWSAIPGMKGVGASVTYDSQKGTRLYQYQIGGAAGPKGIASGIELGPSDRPGGVGVTVDSENGAKFYRFEAPKQ